jgi:hypothetical protein
MGYYGDPNVMERDHIYQVDFSQWPKMTGVCRRCGKPEGLHEKQRPMPPYDGRTFG